MATIHTIKHLWFDFTDTIAAMDKAAFDDLIYSSYADVKKGEVTSGLINEYKELLKQYKSNSAVFVSLGLPSDFLSKKANDSKDLLHLTDANIPSVLDQLKDIIPISIFSNTRLDTILPALGIELSWITHRLGPDVVKKPKPALDGFYKMIELSEVLPQDILYIGDDVEKDLAPAKEVGMQTGLLWKQSDQADYCFTDFEDIRKFFIK